MPRRLVVRRGDHDQGDLGPGLGPRRLAVRQQHHAVDLRQLALDVAHAHPHVGAATALVGQGLRGHLGEGVHAGHLAVDVDDVHDGGPHFLEDLPDAAPEVLQLGGGYGATGVDDHRDLTHADTVQRGHVDALRHEAPVGLRPAVVVLGFLHHPALKDLLVGHLGVENLVDQPTDATGHLALRLGRLRRRCDFLPDLLDHSAFLAFGHGLTFVQHVRTDAPVLAGTGDALTGHALAVLLVQQLLVHPLTGQLFGAGVAHAPGDELPDLVGDERLVDHGVLGDVPQSGVTPVLPQMGHLEPMERLVPQAEHDLLHAERLDELRVDEDGPRTVDAHGRHPVRQRDRVPQDDAGQEGMVQDDLRLGFGELVSHCMRSNSD